MLNVSDAIRVVEKNLPGGRLHKYVIYKNLYVFHVTLAVDGEEGYDPFYSVDRNTGRFKEFSVFDDGDLGELTRLFLAAKQI